MDNTDLLEQVAQLALADPSALDKIKARAEEIRLVNVANAAKSLPKVELSAEEFASIKDYVRAGAARQDPWEIVAEIEDGFESGEQGPVLVGFCDLFALLRANYSGHLFNRKVQKMNEKELREAREKIAARTLEEAKKNK